MSEKEFLMDDEIIQEDDKSVEAEFDELMEDEPIVEKKKTAFSELGKGLKNAVSSFESAVEKTGITADKVGAAADKLSKATAKFTKGVKDTSKKIASNLKEADYEQIKNDVKEKVSGAAGAVSSKTKEIIDKSKTVITEEQMQTLLDSCYEKSVNGIPGVSKSIDQLVDDYLSKSKSPELAAKALINNQLIKCTTSGFLTSLGGLITLPVAVPANVASVLYVQMRMIAAVAKIGGYDPSSDQVQTLVYACMTGQAVGDVLKSAGVKIGNKLAVTGIQKITGATLTKINRAVGFRLITKFGEKGIINLGKMVPVVGGVVGGGFDYLTTKTIAKNAYKAFILDDLS